MPLQINKEFDTQYRQQMYLYNQLNCHLKLREIMRVAGIIWGNYWVLKGQIA
jgi:hypothetical protein